MSSQHINGALFDQTIATVRASKKYHALCDDIIHNVATREIEKLGKRAKLNDVVKATKNTLHQIGGAYFDQPPNYSAWLTDLITAHHASQTQYKQTLHKLMAQHTSTRERLPILDYVFTRTLSHLPPIFSVLDIACGLNPLAREWMPLAPECNYVACDIYTDLIQFINEFCAIKNLKGHAIALDVTHTVPQNLTADGQEQAFDLAILLKCLPCLDQIDKFASIRLLDRVNAKYLLISYPIRTLCGNAKGMSQHYELQFNALAQARAWQYERFEFDTELVFLVQQKSAR
jgi:16S rRNA (guanine(1405)-N(7))-methyltransferase